MLIPVVAGATLYKGAKVVSNGLPHGVAGPMIVGTIGAAVSGFLAIAFLLRLLRTSSLPAVRLLPAGGRRRGDPDHRHRPAPGDLLTAARGCSGTLRK